MADGRQRRLVVELMGRRGFPSAGMVSDAHRACGAGDDDIGASLGKWVDDLDQRTVSSLIDRLYTGECAAAAAEGIA